MNKNLYIKILLPMVNVNGNTRCNNCYILIIYQLPSFCLHDCLLAAMVHGWLCAVLHWSSHGPCYLLPDCITVVCCPTHSLCMAYLQDITGKEKPSGHSSHMHAVIACVLLLALSFTKQVKFIIYWSKLQKIGQI